MIKKLQSIKRYGRFLNYVPSIREYKWDGTFKPINIIYAPNGSGKTSIAMMFRSLSLEDLLVEKKKTFDENDSPEIIFRTEDNKELAYKNGQWKNSISKIEVFDSFYFEENLYTITLDNDPNKLNFFELGSAEEIKRIKEQLSVNYEALKKARSSISNHKNYVKQLKKDKPLRSKAIEKADIRTEELAKKRDDILRVIKKLQEERMEILQTQCRVYLHNINSYLAFFTDSLALTEIKIMQAAQQKKISVIYGLKINGHEITIADRSSRENTSLKYYLSDGDKNALSLSFFLAKLKMISNIDEYSVVIDDPFTSFDFQRKTATISQLSRLSKKVKQFFLLTHDLHFANDFCKFIGDCNYQTLQICKKKNQSFIYGYDLKAEMISGINKDISTLWKFENEELGDSQTQLRDVIRCIRPSIEGLFRIKYFCDTSDTEWLGDFIKKIRSADGDPTSKFYRLISLLSEIEEINDYSKSYHHSEPNHYECPISSQELHIYVRRTLELLEKL